MTMNVEANSEKGSAAAGIAFTLTMKQGLMSRLGYTPLDESIAEGERRLLEHRLNRRLLGNRHRKHGEQLKGMLWVERGANGDQRLHIHGGLILPLPWTLTFASRAIKQEWARSDWHMQIVDFRPLTNLNGWLGYSQKQ